MIKNNINLNYCNDDVDDIEKIQKILINKLDYIITSDSFLLVYYRIQKKYKIISLGRSPIGEFGSQKIYHF